MRNPAEVVAFVLVLFATMLLHVTTAGGAIVVTGDRGGQILVEIVYLGSNQTNLGVMDSYEVRLVDDGPAADAINTVDVNIVPDPSDNPLGLYQVAAFGGAVNTPDMQFASYLGSAIAWDTHFNLWNPESTGEPGWQCVLQPATEDNDMAGGMNAAGGKEGFGQSLRVISTYLPIGTISLAQVVVPAGTSALLTGVAAAPNGETFAFGPPDQGGINIPEPTVLAMLVMGGLLVLGKRK